MCCGAISQTFITFKLISNCSRAKHLSSASVFCQSPLVSTTRKRALPLIMRL